MPNDIKVDMVETAAPLIATHTILSMEESCTRSNGRLRVKGPSQHIGVRNSNNRVYPRSVWENNLRSDSAFSMCMKDRRTLGELEHPDTGTTRLHSVSHLVEKAWIDTLNANNEYGVEPGDYVMTQSLVLDTPNGRILRELFEVKIPVGISSRGRGNVVSVDGTDIVQDDYELIVWDYVENPSVKEARHKVIGEQGEAPPPGVPEGPGPVPLEKKGREEFEKPKPISRPKAAPDVLSRSTTLCDKIKELIAQGGKIDVPKAAEMFSSALEVLDDIGANDDPEFSKSRGEILALSSLLADILQGGKSKKKGEGSKESSTKSDSEKEKEEKTEAVNNESPLEDLAVAYSKERRTDQGVVYKGELENILKRAGHELDQDKLLRLAEALRGKGYDVKDSEYGKVPTAQGQAERSSSMGAVAGKPVSSASAVIESLAKKTVEQKAQIDGMKESVPKTKFEAVKKVCEQSVERLKKAESNYAILSKRHEAAKQIIAELVTRFKQKTVDMAVDEAVRNNSSLEPLSDILRECTNPKDVSTKVDKMLEALGSKPKKMSKPNIVESKGAVSASSVPKNTRRNVNENTVIETVIDGLASRGM